MKTDEVISVSKLTFNNLPSPQLQILTFFMKRGSKYPLSARIKKNPFHPAFRYFLRVYISIFIPIGQLLFELHDFDLTARNSNCSHFGQILTSVKNYHNFLNNWSTETYSYNYQTCQSYFSLPFYRSQLSLKMTEL